MKAIVLRVTEGKVFVKEKRVAQIGEGLAVFLGIENKDSEEDLKKMVDKVVNLRIFEDENKKLKYSLKDKNYSLLCIPNFSLCASVKKGRRPSFENVKPKEKAGIFFEKFISLLRKEGINVESGVFAEFMKIDLKLNGPLNIIIEI